MAPSVIHDVNNALNTILSAAFLIDHHADDPDAVRHYAERVRVAAEQGAELVRALSGTTALPRGPVMTSMGDGHRPSQRVLVVEDVPEVAEVVRRLVQRAGHEVTCVGSCADARARLLTPPPAPFDLLLTDVGLPDGSGWELAAVARAQWPGLRIGVVTGAHAADDPPIRTPDGTPTGMLADFIIRKPLSSADLLVHLAGEALPAAS
jgi:CheY-like chemotaxis protein